MIGLVHLVSAPLGSGPVREFLRSYHDHPPGAEHELVIVLNGAQPQGAGGTRNTGAGNAGGALSRETLLAELGETKHRLIVLDRPVPDLAAYGLAARELSQARLCFTNSRSVALTDRWLSMLTRALDEPNVGLAGATASWETQARWIRGRARYWPYQLARLRRARREYPHFPNPHIRTTSFMLARELVLALKLHEVSDKRDAHLLESGRRSITRQIQDRAMRAVVVGCDGRVYGIKNWAVSRTYRSGEQDNLLVADSGTRDWQLASPRLKRRLSHDAWGEYYVGPGGTGADGSQLLR